MREHRQRFTPQKRVLGMWFNIAKPQDTMEAANQVIREKLRARHQQSQPKH